MPPQIPCFLEIAFLTIVFITFCALIALCHHQWKKSDKAHRTVWLGLFLLLWLAPSGYWSYTGFFPERDTFPGRLHLFGLFPNIVAILALLLIPKCRRFLVDLPLFALTLFHMIRIPVELVLWGLYLNKAIPVEMTFEGHNFDILAGLSAPLIAWWCCKQKSRPRLLLIWNIICLCLLLIIIVTANLSFDTPIQKFGEFQPNIALIRFPFTWLATFVAPSVLLIHLITIIKLIKKK